MSEPILVTEVDNSDRKRLMRLLIAAGVVVLALVVPKVFLGGGDEVVDDGLFVATPAPAAPAAPSERVVEVVEAFSSRNPFTPLVSAAAAPGAGAPAAEPPPAASAPEPPVVVPDVSVPVIDFFPTTPPPPVVSEPPPAPPATTPPPAAPPATTPPPAPAGPARFALAEVFQDAAGQVMARVRINDVVHEVVVGRDFADRYRFVSADLQARCASFLYGDSRFELCEGEETVN